MMDKVYNPKAIESRWYSAWEEAGYFKPNDKAAQSFCIALPPPNITGSLHMGHALEATLIDTLIRRQRMQGKATLWQVGTDHASIATQMVVERQLPEGVTRYHVGREALLEKIWEWKDESGGRIIKQLRRMGATGDWSRERFTMDPHMSHAVYDVFIKLYEEGLIYRAQRLVNWDPVFHTALSDLEVINEEEDGFLWHIAYPLADGSASITVATTRPETMLGDVAVAVHPDDERYQKMIGKKIKLPLSDREIHIIADTYVEATFGTGAVKITPAHDFNDYAMGQRHHLPMINIFTKEACINENAPKVYQGLERFAAREKILADLKTAGLLIEAQPYKRSVPRGDRSGAIVEPLLSDQWFVKIESLAKPAIEAVKNGDIRFIPENWSKTYFHWMNNIQDWCISRQLWWGHRIPAWYDNKDNIYVGFDEQDVRKKYQLPADLVLTQDHDVFDTWFSSALWPFATLGWPEQTPDYQRFYPTNVLVTGFDIIFFWVARMIMFGLKFTGKVPFPEVFIHGLICDSEGKKMSKSKGNVIDPIDLIEGATLEQLIQERTKDMMQPQKAKQTAELTKKQFPDGIPEFGTDAVRFTFCSLPSMNRSIPFDLQRVGGYRNFCNKLWNAARFVMMNLQDVKQVDQKYLPQAQAIDRWIISRLQVTIDAVNKALDEYRFDFAAQAIYEFMWYEYCDWYLELTKPILNQESFTPEQKAATQYTLVYVLETILRLLHPMIPFITEEIWQDVAPLLGNHAKSVMVAPYPVADHSIIDENAIADIVSLQHIILAIRNLRGEMQIAPGQQITVLFNQGTEEDRKRIQAYKIWLHTFAKIKESSWLSGPVPESATALVETLEIFVPLEGLIDKKAEATRLQKELTKLQEELTVLEQRLANPGYRDKAPVAVVTKAEQRVAELQEHQQKLKTQLQKMN
jgi:valyl-tRNA synthetase